MVSLAYSAYTHHSDGCPHYHTKTYLRNQLFYALITFSLSEFSIAFFYNTFTALMLAVLKDNWNFNNGVNLLLAFVPFRLKDYLFSSDG